MEHLDLIAKSELEARVSARVLTQVYDDDNDGYADEAAVNQLIRDASSYVLEFYYGNHATEVAAATIPTSLRRLALDAAHAYMCLRHPEYVRGNGIKMFERVDAELKRLREAITVVVQEPPHPPANVGGTTGAIGDDPPDGAADGFFDNMGDFA